MRKSELQRKTKETDIAVKLNLDGEGRADIDSGIGFFDHMLELLASHSGFDISVKAKGDLKVDCHHTVEDVGITLGKCFYEAIGDKVGINRYATFTVPMDESLATAIIDISGRPFLVFDADFTDRACGNFDCEMVEEFFRAFADNAKITLHICLAYGTNTHHQAEAIFKAFAHALAVASTVVSNRLPSSKGVLE